MTDVIWSNTRNSCHTCWFLFTDVKCRILSAAMNPTLNMNMNSPALNLPSQPLATHCFQLSNMFNPSR